MFLLVIFFPIFNSLFIGISGRFFGNIGSSFIACFGLFMNFFFSVFFLIFSFFFSVFFYFSFGSWLYFGPIELFWNFSFDSLALFMFFVVNSISFIVHIFSFGYMHNDPHLSRFMSYISFFTFFMLILVTADNFIQLFLGWEGVGLCSYLLIGFWYTRVSAISSAMKALIVNRISDFAVIIAMLLCFWVFFSFDFSLIFSLSNFFVLNDLYVFNNLIFTNVLSFICLFFFIGSMGKSAQILLHTWLPDAMEGPTPVSALIHAATMVTAGIFLVIKCSTLFEFTGNFLSLLVLIGGLTAFMSGTIGMIQYDIKKVIAYSTCSQLGYMLLACGVSNYFVSFFHLMNHAFFKALLFLCAGCVIHSVNNEQDMRRMGGFIKFLPVVFIFMLIGGLSLAGFTFLTGFFSKDFLLEHLAFFFSSYFFNFTWSFSVCFLFLTTAVTGLYTMRLTLFCFLDLPFFPFSLFQYLHESTKFLLYPLLFLIFGSIFFGFLFKDLFLGVGSDFFYSNVLTYPLYIYMFEAEMLSQFSKVFMFVFFIFFSFGFLPFFHYFFSRSYFAQFAWNFFYKFFGFEVFFFLILNGGLIFYIISF